MDGMRGDGMFAGIMSHSIRSKAYIYPILRLYDKSAKAGKEKLVKC